jgi:hypothetical protein
MSLRDYIQNNYWWKLLSLLLATLTWFTISTGLQQTKTMQQSSVSGIVRPFPSLPITIMTTASDTRGFKVIPDHVFVKVIGKEETLATLQPNEIVVFVDLTANQSANRLRKAVQVRVPDGMFVARVVPDKVDVEPIATSESPATP